MNTSSQDQSCPGDWNTDFIQLVLSEDVLGLMYRVSLHTMVKSFDISTVNTLLSPSPYDLDKNMILLLCYKCSNWTEKQTFLEREDVVIGS